MKIKHRDRQKEWAETVRGYVSGLSDDEQAAILAANAARVYDL